MLANCYVTNLLHLFLCIYNYILTEFVVLLRLPMQAGQTASNVLTARKHKIPGLLINFLVSAGSFSLTPRWVPEPISDPG